MKSLERMMHMMMSTMAKNDDMQKVATDINSRTEEWQNFVQRVNEKVVNFGNNVQQLDMRPTNLEKWKKTDMHDEMTMLKQDAIQEALRAAITTRPSTTTTARRSTPPTSSSSSNSSSTTWKPRVVHIRGLAPFGSPEPDRSCATTPSVTSV